MAFLSLQPQRSSTHPPRTINYAATHSRIRNLFFKATTVEPLPAELAAHLRGQSDSRRERIPECKGGVYGTFKEIIAILIADWQRQVKKGNQWELSLSIRTTCTALAKRCGYHSGKTMYRHILSLLEKGWLVAKVRRDASLELFINEDLIVFYDTNKGGWHFKHRSSTNGFQAARSTNTAAVTAVEEVVEEVVEDITQIVKRIVDNMLAKKAKRAKKT